MSPGSSTDRVIGQLIRQARQEAGMTQEALAKRIGCSKPHLSLMESGQRTVSPQRAAEIEAALDLEEGRLTQAVQWQRVPAELRAQVEQSQEAGRRLAARIKRALECEDMGALRQIASEGGGNVDTPLPVRGRIPVINSVAAGYPREFTDLDYPASVADEYIACPDVTDPNAFAARVVGDSMEPGYREGEIVVFSPAMPTPSGSDCFVRLERDGETTFKRVYFEEGGAGLKIRLQPLNSTYPPQVVAREEVTGMYAAAYVMRKVTR